MKNTLLVTTTLTALCYIPLTAAQPTLDSDGDGQLSFDEIQAHKSDASVERFSQFDSDADGLLSRDERREGRRAMAKQRFSEADLDGSGGLSLEEIQARHPDASGEHFSLRDRDGNGEIGPGELRAGKRARMQNLRAKKGEGAGTQRAPRDRR